MSKVSGRHNPNWVMMGFLASPEDKALGMIVSEAAEMDYKALVMRLLNDAAYDAGIVDVDGNVTRKFKAKYDFYVNRVLMSRAARGSEKKGKK